MTKVSKECQECKVCNDCTAEPEMCPACSTCEECDYWDGKARWAGSKCVPPNARKEQRMPSPRQHVVIDRLEREVANAAEEAMELRLDAAGLDTKVELLEAQRDATEAMAEDAAEIHCALIAALAAYRLLATSYGSHSGQVVA